MRVDNWYWPNTLAAAVDLLRKSSDPRARNVIEALEYLAREMNEEAASNANAKNRAA